MKKAIFILLIFIPCIALGKVIVPMERQNNGLYLIPCTVNGIPMKFIFDTGASSVNISLTEALFLLKNGHIQNSDIIGLSRTQIANGEIVENTKIVLHKIEIGGIEINDIDATVSHNLNAPLLLGQSAISKLGSIQIDGSTLIIKDHEEAEDINGDTSMVSHIASYIIILLALLALFFFLAFSVVKKRQCIPNTNKSENTSSENVIAKSYSVMTWLKNRKYTIYIAYCAMLVVSGLVIELWIRNKRDNLLSLFIENVDSTFGGIFQRIQGIDINRTAELEYEEVSIPPVFKSEFPSVDKTVRKHWNNMFSGIKHAYKITDGRWRIAGLQYLPVSTNTTINEPCTLGIQKYILVPYMICVPDELEFNKEIARDIIEKSLNKVYVDPPYRYNTAADIVSTQNDYFHFVDYDVKREIWGPRFYDEKTGRDPIYDGDKFTGYYWCGMTEIGLYRVIFAYRNELAWRILEKDGFNASKKDRVIYHGITIILFTTLLLLVLFYVNRRKP